MKDERKSFHNPKTVVIKEENRKKKMKIDFRTTTKKYLLKLGESQRKKVIHFVLTFRHAIKSLEDSEKFSFVGFGGFILFCLVETLSK